MEGRSRRVSWIGNGYFQGNLQISQELSLRLQTLGSGLWVFGEDVKLLLLLNCGLFSVWMQICRKWRFSWTVTWKPFHHSLPLMISTYAHTNVSFSSLCIYSSTLGSQETIRTRDSWRSDTRKLQILQFGHSPLKKTCKVCLERKNNWQKSTHSHIPKFFWCYQMFIRGCIHELLPHDESRTCFWRVPRLDQCTVLWWVGKLRTKKKSSH